MGTMITPAFPVHPASSSTAHCPLLAVHHFLLTAHYSLPTTHNSLRALLTTHYFLTRYIAKRFPEAEVTGITISAEQQRTPHNPNPKSHPNPRP